MLGAVELGDVPLGLVLLGVLGLPGSQGLATVAVVFPVVEEPGVELEELPTPPFADVLPVEGVPLAVVGVPVVLLLLGVHGATVVDVPV